ncbi:MAG: YggS family pyridoxal phosphate-dependent enzyme [Culturomica sp.]|jgi:pyridoxal phosphate enzyme (YggS family)|nr:YggS family pyridoxal phosphate-dependent enzyme [Culturomica sp.]
MESIAENLGRIAASLPREVRLVAVSKQHSAASVEEAYRWGQRLFGENKVQELAEKYERLPKDIEWHFIGHLQTNKVKYIVPFVSLIHSADSLKLLQTIDREAGKCGRVVECLLQFHIAEEESKFGLDEREAGEMLESPLFREMRHIRIAGVMGMATYTGDREQIRKEFRRLREIFERLKQDYFAEDPVFREISMGMSGDYELAVEEGSTLVRVGSSLFGERSY